MKVSIFLAAIGLASFLSVGCTSNDRLDVGGVPEWIMGGAKLSSEPAPRKPDNAIISHKRESGPVVFTYITDDRAYPAPPQKKVSKKNSVDVLERGRNYRIKRLFR